MSKVTITPELRDVAAALLALLPDYQSDLESSGKSPRTVIMYVDRTERFLWRIRGND
jgi:hypothetical protein